MVDREVYAVEVCLGDRCNLIWSGKAGPFSLRCRIISVDKMLKKRATNANLRLRTRIFIRDTGDTLAIAGEHSCSVRRFETASAVATSSHRRVAQLR